jgi:hypothetical protein
MAGKVGLVGVLAAIVAAAVLLIAPATGGASGGNGAVQLNGFDCGMVTGNGDFFTVDAPTKTVYTQKGSWNETCKATGVANDTGKAVLWYYNNTGLPCVDATNNLYTLDWQETVSSNGIATLSCHFNGKPKV